ncbi:glycoside hydrolase family 132 protein [Hypoxylon sp. FL1150]|nr:glycoside hydrolase family 132 protein [Hypoxylon sp. FL1150]
MKTTTIQAAIGSAALLLSAQPCFATTQHRHHHLHLEKKHGRVHSYEQLEGSLRRDLQSSYNPNYEARNSSALVSRDGKKKCIFPEGKGLFAVTPSKMNGGWAMAPDQECVSGTWCPIACPSGQVMAQWKPGTTYTYPESTYGGIYCNDDGEIEVPFEGKSWCVEGTGTVEAVNKAGDVVSFCQTCLPGYEDMIIPTDVYGTTTLAVPDMSYWDSTAAHYYINAPGVNADEGCHWGVETEPKGNWSPYVAGANTVGDGSTYVKIGLNPVWQDSALVNTKPDFGLKIECPDGGCNGIPCECDGNGVRSNNKATGAGGADFCVVTVPKGGKANIVVFNLDGSEGGSGSSSSSSSSSAAPESTSTQPSSTQAPTSSSTTTTSSSTSSASPTSTSTSSTPASTSTSSSSKESSTSSSTKSKVSSSTHPMSSSKPSSPSASASVYIGGIFQENGTATTTSFSWVGPSSTSAPIPSADGETTSSETNTNEGAGQRQGGAAIAGLIVAFVAAGYLL